jgi:hypothetical protein
MRNINALTGYYGFDTSPLAGRSLETVEMSEDGTLLTFRFEDGGFVIYGTEGDCCSSTWIEHITVPDIKGATIMGLRDQSMGEFQDPQLDCVRVYQTSFVTEKGEIVVEYRNASNGYYGGSLTGPVAQG